MKILLAIDGSLVTKRMLSYVAAHDELFGPSHDYTVVNVVALARCKKPVLLIP